MDGDGIVLDAAGIPISSAAGEQAAPAIAFDGENYLVVWEDTRGGQSDIYGARVTPCGDRAGPRWVPDFNVGAPAASAPAAADRASAAEPSARPAAAATSAPAPASPAATAAAPTTSAATSAAPASSASASSTAAGAASASSASARTALRRPARDRHAARACETRIRGANCSVGRVRATRRSRAPSGTLSQAEPAGRALRRRGFPVSLVVARRCSSSAAARLAVASKDVKSQQPRQGLR